MNKYPNKVALITGGARRLGKEIAKVVAECNYDIVLNYNSTPTDIVRETVEELSKKSIEVIPYRADISNVKEVKRIFHYISDRFKRLDLVINSAGIFRKVDFFDIDDEILNEFINTNLKSVIITTVEAAKIMIGNVCKPCRIVNLASVGGIQNWIGYIPYSITKAGVIKFTYLSAKRLAPEILVNCISPGTVKIKDEDSETDNISLYPIKRFCRTKDFHKLIYFLIAENEYITGHNFVIDGGKIL